VINRNKVLVKGENMPKIVISRLSVEGEFLHRVDDIVYPQPGRNIEEVIKEELRSRRIVLFSISVDGEFMLMLSDLTNRVGKPYEEIDIKEICTL
jgi:hypothetical protein